MGWGNREVHCRGGCRGSADPDQCTCISLATTKGTLLCVYSISYLSGYSIGIIKMSRQDCYVCVFLCGVCVCACVCGMEGFGDPGTPFPRHALTFPTRQG